MKTKAKRDAKKRRKILIKETLKFNKNLQVGFEKLRAYSNSEEFKKQCETF